MKKYYTLILVMTMTFTSCNQKKKNRRSLFMKERIS